MSIETSMKEDAFRALLQSGAAALLTHAERAPDLVIGHPDNPYMRRWFLIKDNDGLSVYLHHILRDDDARALHDHRADNVSIVLAGTMKDLTPAGDRILGPGDVLARKAEDLHRLEVEQFGSRGCWTLWVKGPNRREWGFQTPDGWCHWTAFPQDSDRMNAPGYQASSQTDKVDP